MKFATFTIASAAALLVATPARAGVTIVFTQGTTGVTVDVSGSIDTSSFTYIGSNTLNNNYMNARNGDLLLLNTDYDIYSFASRTNRSFGTTNGYFIGTGVSGTFAVYGGGANLDNMRLPTGYVAGSALSASAFFSGLTFAKLGATAVDFSQSLGGGETIDYVFRTAAVTGAVPEPTTWAMMIAGFGLIGGAMRRRAVMRPGVA